MTIDWTQPVETTEDPPRPVRVLATDGPCAKFPVIAVVGNAFHREFSLDGRQNEAVHVIPLTLRNVAPPKPEPVLIEGWVNFVRAETAYEGGTFWIVRNGAVWSTREWALIEAEKMRDVIGTAYIRVMSDGSPLKELAAMLDEATGPSRELDVASFQAIFPATRVYEAYCPPLTSSIDAALALVERLLPGWGWQINSGAYAILRPPKATGWSSSLCFDGDAPTAPIAILRALAAALIAQEKADDQA